jgi:hypothetical protein
MNKEEQIAEAKTCREQIAKLQAEQDALYAALAEKLQIGKERDGWLWDYVFNTEDGTDYEKYVEEIVWQ